VRALHNEDCVNVVWWWYGCGRVDDDDGVMVMTMWSIIVNGEVIMVVYTF